MSAKENIQVQENIDVNEQKNTTKFNNITLISMKEQLTP